MADDAKKTEYVSVQFVTLQLQRTVSFQRGVTLGVLCCTHAHADHDRRESGENERLS